MKAMPALLAALVFAAVMLAGCGAIEQQSSLARPAVAGRPYVAGVGDTVMDLKLTQSLPNIVGKADLFGRTRDAGRVTVRFVGLEDGQALFVRQDVLIQSNETTLSQMPLILPTWQSSTVSGTIGTVPVSATGSSVGTAVLAPTPSSSYPIQAGQIQIAAPVGGSVLVEGHRITVLRRVEGGIEYAVD